MIRNTLAAAIALTLVPAVASAQDKVSYSVDIDAQWTASAFPKDYPSNAHFSGFVAASHNADYALFADGAVATKGLETLSETGNGGPLSEEARAQMGKGTVGDIADSGPQFSFPARISFKVDADTAHPFVSFAAMVAPSPDWFTGASRIALQKDGKWVDETKVTLYAWDAGTDSGTTYKAADADTQPRQSVRMNMAPNFSNNGSLTPIGTATLKRIVATN